MITVSIGIVCYSRPLHLEAVLGSLFSEISESVSIDIERIVIAQDCAEFAARTEVRRVVRKYVRMFRAHGLSVNVIEQEKRIGLKRSILLTLRRLLESDSSYFMLLEDDILLKKGSFENTLKAADKLLSQDSRFVQYSMFSPIDIPLSGHFTSRRLGTWGWIAKTRSFPKVSEFFSIDVNDNLQKFFDEAVICRPEFVGVPKMLKSFNGGNLDIWSLNFMAWMFKNDKLTVYPLCSQIRQIGFDGSGQNCGGRAPARPMQNVSKAKSPGTRLSSTALNVLLRWCQGAYYTKLGVARRKIEQRFF